MTRFRSLRFKSINIAQFTKLVAYKSKFWYVVFCCFLFEEMRCVCIYVSVYTHVYMCAHMHVYTYFHETIHPSSVELEMGNSGFHCSA